MFSDKPFMPHTHPKLFISILLLALAVLAAYTTFVVLTVWNWLLVPAGLPSLQWVNAFGIVLILITIPYKYTGHEADYEHYSYFLYAWSPVTSLFVRPSAVLFAAAVVKLIFL